MKGILAFTTVTLFVSGLLLFTGASGENDQKKIQQGKYIVHHVAMCIMCHTPRDNQGHLMEGELLQGAPIPVKSPYANQQWAPTAPTIRGLGGFQEEDIVHLLMTGQRLNGEKPQRPMPPFRMTEDDARAVVAYLKSFSAPD